MRKLIDLTGNRYGRLVVLKRAYCENKYGTHWLCKCDCGNEVVVNGDNLKRGRTKSCKCFQQEARIENNIIHNMSKTRLFRIWRHIKERCYKNYSHAYKDYGGRGIKMSEEWQNDFMSFYNWSMENGYTDDLSIDRIDVNGNYEPNNCRWVSMLEQQNNRRNNRLFTYEGETHTMAEWARIKSVNYKCLAKKINENKMSFEEAINVLVKHK